MRKRKPLRKKYRFESGTKVIDRLTGKSGTIIGGYGELFPRQYAVLYDGRADDGSMEGRTLKPKYINRIIETEADNEQ